MNPASISTFNHLCEAVSGFTQGPLKDETSRLVISLYRAAFKPHLEKLTDEKCDICEGIIPFELLTHAVCERGHQFRKSMAWEIDLRP
jgi:Putative zinc-finger of transcription factor IIIC complex